VTVIDNAIYVDGRRVASPDSLDATFDALEEHGGFAWIGLYRPDTEELQTVADEFHLHELAVEDALNGHQRAKLDRYGDIRFAVLRPARYIEETDTVEFGEVHLFIGPDFVIVIRHAESPDIAKVRRRLEAAPELLARGPLGVFYAVADQVVDEYDPVAAGLDADVEQVEDELFESGDAAVTRRIYDLTREVSDFRRATKPLIDIFTALRDDLPKEGVELEVRRSFRDVLDHTIRIVERADAQRQLLQSALQTHMTLVAQQQNESVKKVSGWAAILFTPTLVATIYGMNFSNIPELHWALGYPFAIVLMVALGVVLYAVFKTKGWL
jgi:magnesium transporter